MTSLDELKQKVLDTDLSVNNPKVQSIIELQIEETVIRDYDLQKEIESISPDSEKYVLDNISVNETSYNPRQILDHVKARDEIGMHILREIDKKARENPNKHLSTEGLKADLAALVNEENAHKVALYGARNLTHRDMLQGFVDLNPEVNLVQLVYLSAIDDLFYVKEEQTPKTTPKQPGLLAKIKNYLFK